MAPNASWIKGTSKASRRSLLFVVLAAASASSAASYKLQIKVCSMSGLPWSIAEVHDHLWPKNQLWPAEKSACLNRICFGICLVFFLVFPVYISNIYIYIYIHLCGYIIPHVVTGMMSSRGSYPQIAASFRLNTIYPRYPQLYTPLYTTHPIYFIYPKHSQLYTAHIIS